MPLKSGAFRSLRSQVQIQTPRIPSGVFRSLTATAKAATSTTGEISESIPTGPLISPESRISFHRPTTFAHNPRHSAKSPFDDLLNALTRSLTTTAKPHLPTLSTLLRTYTSDPSHWSAYAHANPDKQYTRNLVCEVPNIFNLLLLVWTPGKRSPVHDHADSHCLMKILKGELKESRFKMPRTGQDGGLVETQRVKVGTDKVVYISDQLGLHEISNPSPTEYAVSLHLYTPPNAALYGCHVFDPETGKSKHVMQSAYDSVAGVVTRQ